MSATNKLSSRTRESGWERCVCVCVFIFAKWLEEGLKKQKQQVPADGGGGGVQNNTKRQMGFSAPSPPLPTPVPATSLSGWEQQLPEAASSPPVPQRPRSCHCRFAPRRASHVISQPILEHECVGSRVKGSVHLAHPSALHQTPSVGPAGLLRQACSAHGDGGWGGSGGAQKGGLKVKGRTGRKSRARWI